MPKVIYASTKNKDMFYAVKMDITDPFFVIDMGEKKYVFLDHREFGLFKEENRNPDIEPVLLNPILREIDQNQADTSQSNEVALVLFEKYGLLNVPVQVPADFPLAMADFLRSRGVNLVPTSPFYPERLKKTAEEVQAIQESIQKTEGAFDCIASILKKSVIEGERILYKGVVLTSDQLKREVDRYLLEVNMIDEEGIIVSSGLQTAIPHHPGKGSILPHQPIVCDIFPRGRETGYYADITRTFVKGAPSSQLQKMYDAVREVQEVGIRLVEPGRIAGDIHAKCSQMFLDFGYDVGDMGFVHSTGHGLGLDVHEEPRVSSTSESRLESGHVITIEPGLYYPKIGGIRIEDDVLVTDKGREVLSKYSKDWIIP